MSDLQGLFVKKLFIGLCAGLILTVSTCKKETDGKTEVPHGNPEQVILTVNGMPVTEDQTDGKLGAYLFYNPYATEDQIRGARKSIALSVAESILIDEKMEKEGLVLSEEEKLLAGKYLEFFYKDAVWIQKNAEYKNIPEEEMYKDNLLEYKKMKILSVQPDIEKPTANELNRFIEENRSIYGEKPERKTVYQILVRYEGEDPSSSEAAVEKLEKAREELKEGKDFRSVAKKYSDLDPEEPASFLGVLWKDCLYYGEAVAETVWALNPGEYSAVYSGEPGSCSVFYVEDILPEEKLPETELRQWAELLLILQKNEIRYHLLFEDLFKEAEVIYSLEYDAVPGV